MFSNPPSDPVPSLNPLQHVVSRQLVTTMFLLKRGSPPYGVSLFRQVASSPVSTEQLETETFWQHVISIPSVLGPFTGFLIAIPLMVTLSQLYGRNVHPGAFSMRTSSMRSQRQFTNSSNGLGRPPSFGFNSCDATSTHASSGGRGTLPERSQKCGPCPSMSPGPASVTCSASMAKIRWRGLGPFFDIPATSL